MNGEAKHVAELCGTASKIETPTMIPLWGRKQPGFGNWNKNGERRLYNGRPLKTLSREREEQLARTRLEYEDRVQQEEIRRAALEAQLQTVIPDHTFQHELSKHPGIRVLSPAIMGPEPLVILAEYGEHLPTQ